MVPFAGNSDFANEIRNKINQFSKDKLSVLLVGERGTGKRLFAQNVHFLANGTMNGFYEINCKSINLESFEKQLLDIYHASDNNNKTLFLENISFLPLDFQNKVYLYLLKNKQSKNNLKLFTSTEIDLKKLASESQFSLNLFNALSEVVLNFIPLRQRKDDIIPICDYYIKKFNKLTGLNFIGVRELDFDLINNYIWKGNVDELINAVQRAFIIGDESFIKAQDLGVNLFPNEQNNSELVFDENITLKQATDEFKKYYVTKVLKENNWNQTKTAKILGIQRTYVIRLMNELQIRK